MKKPMVFLLAFLLLFTSLSSSLAAKKNENTEPTPEPIPEPTLSPDAQDYDPDHPENLSADQLYALSAVLMTQDKGEVIFEKVVEDVDGAGGTYVGGVLGVEKPSLCIGGSLPDVSGDGSVLGEHGHCVNNLFDFVCHFVTAFQASSNSS